MAALLQPFQSVLLEDAYPGDAAKVAALVYFVVKGHACWTGAKRITTVLTLTFLDLNDYWLDATPDEVADEVERMAESDPAHRAAVLETGRSWVGARLRRKTAARREWRLTHGSWANSV
jgi:prophage maintenance system killer protein